MPRNRHLGWEQKDSEWMPYEWRDFTYYNWKSRVISCCCRTQIDLNQRKGSSQIVFCSRCGRGYLV